jgi:hypothetical protein
VFDTVLEGLRGLKPGCWVHKGCVIYDTVLGGLRGLERSLGA